MPTYLDANGNPIQGAAPSAAPPVYLDPNTGEPMNHAAPAAAPAEGFWHSLGAQFGLTDATDSDRQRYADHPVQSAVDDLLNTPVRMAQGIYNQAKKSVGDLSQAGKDALAGNGASAGYHAVRGIPVVGPAMDKAADQYLDKNFAGETGTLLGAAAQAAPMALGATDSAAPQRAVIPNPSLPSGVVDAAKTAGAKYLPALVDGPPESLVTRAVKPGKNNVNWSADVQNAIPLMKSAEAQLGHPISGIDDALEANTLAKKAVWQQYQQRLGPAAQMGATVDGNQIADAMMGSIDKRTALQNHGLAQKVQQVADTYRRPMTLDEAEDFLQSANKDLNSYYAKNKVGQRVAENDPEVSSTVAEAGALRDALYSKLDQVAGPGAAQLKQSYGSLMNVEKELYGRQLVAARQNPESLSEQMSTARGVGKIARGMITLSPGDVIEGAQNIGVSRVLKARNSSDAMIARAFEKASPAQPFPMPSAPQFAGFLPRGAIQTPAPADASGSVAYQPPQFDATTRAQRLGLLLPEQAGGKIPLPYYPEMSGGERIAALMQLLRQSPQKALPETASPIQLPPPR